MLRLPKVYANAIRNFVVAANGATEAQPYRVSRSVEERQNFVNGHRIKPEKSNRHFPVYEPATGNLFGSINIPKIPFIVNNVF